MLPVAVDAVFDEDDQMDISDDPDVPAPVEEPPRSSREASAASEPPPPVDKGKARARGGGKSIIFDLCFYYFIFSDA